MKINPCLNGTFRNECEGVGFDVHWLRIDRPRLFKFLEKQIYLFTLSKETPLAFVQEDGTVIMPCKPDSQFESDLGSIPSSLQKLVRKEGPSYPFHDRAYNGHYFWVKFPKQKKFVPVAVSKWTVDMLLRTMLMCQNPKVGKAKATMIWMAVVSFGIFAGYKKFKGVLPDPVDFNEKEEDPLGD
jgi:hypothetical protein